MDWKTIKVRATTTIRLNWRALLVLLGAVAAAIILLRRGLDSPAQSFERELLLVLTGAALAAVGKLVIDLITKTEAYRQGAYTDRAKAVQEILAAARDMKVAALAFLMMVPRGQKGSAPGEQLFRKSCDDLLRLAWHHRVWIGKRGENVVREFIESMRKIDNDDNKGKEQLEVEINERFARLEALLMGDLGFWPS